jgi:transcriptional regulator with XRE-family HTH domain
MNTLSSLVRQYRAAAGLTQKQLAAAIGTSAAFISLLEQGKSEPSIGVLRSLARVLKVPVAAFFDGGAETPPANVRGMGKTDAIKVVHPKERKRFVNPSRPAILWELLSPDLRRAIEFVSVRYEPGAPSGELIGHQGEECGLVVKGRLEVRIEDEVYALDEGDSISFDSTRPHSFRNAAEEETITIWAITPPSF